ncbi:MAG: ArnT family glycosyltransferase [Planctomycetota bacterium]
MLARGLLLLFCTALVLLPSWLRADWDGTEGRRVQIALEMLRYDSWMVPLLGGAPTWAKPPLHYWLLMLCERAFGDGYMWLRLPSVLGAWGSAWLAGELLRSRFGGSVGWLGAFGILCSPLVVFAWPTAEIDPLFASLVGASLWLLATGAADGRRTLVLWSGLVGGLAFLQKGPPYFLFAAGAYLVWLRHRRMRHGLWHFVPLMLVVLAYYVPLWSWHVDAGEMLRVANEESVGRIATFRLKHVLATPGFWLRAIGVLCPFGLWCLWEWRGERDARMGARDLVLRACSGGAVLAVAVLTLFPGRPTRYLLPNVMLFTVAVAPAVGHFFRHRAPVPGFAQWLLRLVGLLGGVGLLVLPFVPRAGAAALGLALVAALAPFWATTPRRVVLASLLLPVLASWTIGLERSLRWSFGKRARVFAGQLLRREIDRLGAAPDLGSLGHIDSSVLLASGLWPKGDERSRRLPETRWMLHEETDWLPVVAPDHVVRMRFRTPFKVFVLRERRDSGAVRDVEGAGK